MSTLDIILPFLGPAADLFSDPDVTEVMINRGGREVYVERRGIVTLVSGLSLDPILLDEACKVIARVCGTDVSNDRPILDAHLEDGSRVAALMAPCSVDGTTLTIRRFPRVLSLADLCADGTVPLEAKAPLLAAIVARQNILIAGETDSGKTTILTALAAQFPATSRILVIEETAEIKLPNFHVVRWETRRARPAAGSDQAIPAVTMSDLVRASLRHRPDRLVLGEIRGPEAWDLLQLLNTGHAGSMTTIHANPSRTGRTFADAALIRLAHCVRMAIPELNHHALMEDIAQIIHLVVHMTRTEGVRQVAEIRTVTGYDMVIDRFLTTAVFAQHSANVSSQNFPAFQVSKPALIDQPACLEPARG